MSEPEDAVRRALHEVADQTNAAEGGPPPLDERVVPISSWRPSHTQRIVLGAVAAVIAVVGGVLAAALVSDEDDPDTLETADDTSTTTEGTSSTSSSSTSSTATTATTATSTVPGSATTLPQPSRSEDWVHVAGDEFDGGWRVYRSSDEDCLFVVFGAGHLADEICDLAVPDEPLGAIRTLEVPQPDSSVRTLFIAAVGGGVDGVERFPGAQINGRAQLGRIEDPFLDGLSFLVTDQVSAADALILRSGQDPVGGVYDLRLRTGAPFGRVPGYGKAAESLSNGLLQEIGLYPDDGDTCVLARQLLPDPRAIVDACIEGSGPFGTTAPTTLPGAVDLFGIVPEAAAGDWVCELPDGDPCGSGLATVVAGAGAAALSGFGPISVVDSNGDRVDHVVIVLSDQTRFEVPIPPA